MPAFMPAFMLALCLSVTAETGEAPLSLSSRTHMYLSLQDSPPVQVAKLLTYLLYLLRIRLTSMWPSAP